MTVKSLIKLLEQLEEFGYEDYEVKLSCNGETNPLNDVRCRISKEEVWLTD
jgi:hypothetical protein